MITLGTTERAYPWGVLRSTNASKVKFALVEKQLPWRVERVAPGDLWRKPPTMLARHPLGKVPWIADGDHVIWDSTVILEYLEEAYPTQPLLPTDPLARARVRMLETFIDEALLVGDLPGIWMPWWAPEDKRDTEAMAASRHRLTQRALPWLETQLSDDRAFLGGNSLTIADTGMAAIAMVLQVDGMSLDAFPLLQRYLQRLRERPAYACIDPATALEDSEQSTGT